MSYARIEDAELEKVAVDFLCTQGRLRNLRRENH